MPGGRRLSEGHGLLHRSAQQGHVGPHLPRGKGQHGHPRVPAAQVGRRTADSREQEMSHRHSLLARWHEQCAAEQGALRSTLGTDGDYFNRRSNRFLATSGHHEEAREECDGATQSHNRHHPGGVWRAQESCGDATPTELALLLTELLSYLIQFLMVCLSTRAAT